MEILADLVCVGRLESDTMTVVVNNPDFVGVPEMIPVVAARFSPEGKLLPEAIVHL